MKPGNGWDWRESYVICQHVFDDESKGTRHRGFRVCCEACYPDFLFAENLTTEERGPLAIGKVQP